MMSLEVGKVKVRVTAVAICGGPGHEHVAVSVADRAGNTGTWYGHLSDVAMKGTAGTLRDLGWDPEGRDWRL